jgi:hypothetical protein
MRQVHMTQHATLPRIACPTFSYVLLRVFNATPAVATCLDIGADRKNSGCEWLVVASLLLLTLM